MVKIRPGKEILVSTGLCCKSCHSLMILSILRSNRSSAAASTLSTSGAMGLSEKTFLNPKKMTATKEVRDEKGPSLDDFDKEIEIYQVCKVVVISSSLTSDETVRRICQKKSLFLPFLWKATLSLFTPNTIVSM